MKDATLLRTAIMLLDHWPPDHDLARTAAALVEVYKSRNRLVEARENHARIAEAMSQLAQTAFYAVPPMRHVRPHSG